MKSKPMIITSPFDPLPAEDEARAEQLYEAIVAQLPPQDYGKYLVLDFSTGRYEVDADDIAASERAHRHSKPEHLIMYRVGVRDVVRLGGAVNPRRMREVSF